MEGLFTNRTNLYFLEIVVGVMMVILILISCSGDVDNEVQYQNINPMNNDSQEMDAQFLVDAVELDMMDMQLGELAQKKASTPGVNNLGRKLEEDHSASCKQLVSLAKQKMVTLPLITTKEAQTAYYKLNEKSNTQFEKAYCTLMVSKHKDAIALFEKVSNNTKDPDIKTWAESMIPVLKSHLDLALQYR